MRIAVSGNSLQPYVQPSKAQAPPKLQTVDATPLPPEKAKQLIAMGLFNHDPNKVLWTLSGGPSAAGNGTIQAIKAVPLSGGLQMQAWSPAGTSVSTRTPLFETANLLLPHLEQAAAGSDSVGAVADGIAVLMSTPDMFQAWVGPKRWSLKNVVLYGLNLLRLAGIANQFLHIPHADTPLQVVTMIFKCGDEVFVASKPKGVAG